MDIKIAIQWAALLFCSGLGVLLLAVLFAFVWHIWQLLFGSEDSPPSLKHAWREWSKYNEKHDKLSELNKTNAELQKQIDDLKRELEEVKEKSN